MNHPTQTGTTLQSIPMLAQDTLYVGIDIGKATHLAGFISTTLLTRHQRFESCPALSFENSREGFRSLLDRISSYVPLEQTYVLFEVTGHYHRALLPYLQELGISVYVIHVQRRQAGLLKTDKRDALNLANHLYNQLEKGIQVAEPLQAVRRLAPPSAAAAQLRGMIHHRDELIAESTQRKNKLTAICDELFPEFTRVLKNPNLPVALAIREHFPTPAAVARARTSELSALRKGRYPLPTQLTELQQLAQLSIGTKDAARVRGLVFEQKQLIEELALIHRHVEQLETEITQIVEQSREGKILTSIPGVGIIPAAAIIASIGNIANFQSAAALKAYFGWAPSLEQSGTSLDRVHLSSRGTRPMKKMMYLVVWAAIKKDCEWAKIYQRLVPIKCSYDERTRRYVGRGKVMGRIAGQIISVMYALLKKDAETLSQCPTDVNPPDPILYDPEIHQRHRAVQYRAHIPEKPLQILQFPIH